MDVAAWLRGLGLERHVPTFRENEIDAEVVPELTEGDLEKLGIPLGHRKKLLRAIATLSAGEVSPPPATPVPGAERRQLTVLFCDLVGSTELAARLDPEDLGEVIGAYCRCVADVVGRYEGHVAKYLGDGVLAYFGYPKAHEDDAERAVRAGLELTRAVGELDTPAGERLATRVGIATGLIVVGELIGEGAAREEAIVGETPNLAARLQTFAEPESVVVSASTHRLTGGAFDYADLGRHDLKGFAAPAQLWRVVGARAAARRFEARQAASPMPLLGRDREFALLLDRWRRARGGEGQVVLLTGEPGIGKSRLTLALRQRLREEQRISLCYYGSPYHADTALWPVIEQLEHAAAFDPNDAPAAKLEHAAAFDPNDAPAAKLDKLEALLAHAGEGPRVAAPVLARLLGVPTDGRYPPLDVTPPVLRARTLELLLAQLVGLARRQPVLVVLEDAHWLDPTTRELFDRVVACVRTLPALLVVTARPGFVPHWLGDAHVTAFPLDRLGRGQGAALVKRVSGGKTLPADVTEQILAKTDGVPLFIEELTRAVLESGLLRATADGFVLDGPLPTLAIPATLRDSLMARLDRLNLVKDLAQVAACIGRAFTGELLAAVSGCDATAVRLGLDRLVAAELIQPRRGGATGGYMFKHALVQELARDSLLKSRRRDLHRRIAAAIETRQPDTAANEPEILAHHYAEAGLPDRAASYRLAAGRLAKARHAMPEATAHLDACLHLAAQAGEALRDVRRDAWLLLGDLASLADDLDRANGCYDRALALAEGEVERRAVGNRHHRLSYASRDGARLAFYEHGSGEPAIVFVNPIVYGLATFQPILERLCQEFRIITVDCRGAGRSDPLVRPYGIARHAEDLRAIIDAAGAAPIVGVGISRGSNQLLHLADKHPELIAKLMIVGTPVGGAELGGKTFFDTGYLRRRAEAYAREDVDTLVRLQAEFVYTEEDATELRRMTIERCRHLPRETILSFYDPDPDMNVAPLLDSIAVPTLVAHGREDHLNDFAAAEHIAARLPGSRLYAFEGKGHNPMFSATEEFCEVLKRFVRPDGSVNTSTRGAIEAGVEVQHVGEHPVRR